MFTVGGIFAYLSVCISIGSIVYSMFFLNQQSSCNQGLIIKFLPVWYMMNTCEDNEYWILLVW